MLINEVSKVTGLTKKAIEYYTLQELVSPIILGNGYRDYSNDDIERLNKISILRKLDISIQEIKAILYDNSNTVLKVISVRKELSLQREVTKREVLDKLSSGISYDQISAKLKTIDNAKTITEKLLEAFPGYYGRFICLHFARFLNEHIKTKSQQSAYETIINFLDDMPLLSLPKELQEYLTEATDHIGTEQITEMIVSTKKSIENPDDFMSENKEVLESYLAYKQTEEYKKSPAYKMMEIMRQFNNTSGYYDVFIPAMKELSSSYSEYCKHLEIANEKLIAQYPEIENMSD